MDRHCRNAVRVAQMLAEHPAVAEVFYPGLPAHPGHKTAQEQMRAFGGMVSFRLLAGEEAAVRACGRTRLFTLGESLGGVESLIEHPARMTHASVGRLRSWRSRPTWSGCRWASRTATTCSTTCARPWSRASTRRHRPAPVRRKGPASRPPSWLS